LGKNDLGAASQFVDELRHQLGRMLEITIHHDDGVALRVMKPRAQCHLVAEIAHQRHIADAAVGCGEALYLRERIVGRAIIDEYDLPIRHGLQQFA